MKYYQILKKEAIMMAVSLLVSLPEKWDVGLGLHNLVNNGSLEIFKIIIKTCQSRKKNRSVKKRRHGFGDYAYIWLARILFGGLLVENLIELTKLKIMN